MAAPAHAVSLARTDGLTYDPDLACSHLIQADPRLGALMIRAGPFTMRPQPTQSLFAALMRSIVYQQLTGKAAETILRRAVRVCAPGRFPTPRQVLAVTPEQLREAGLSTAKTAAVRDLAAKTLDGTVPSLARIRRMEDEEIIERLTLVRGIGRWTVEMLLIFRLGRPDVLPADDYGIRKGFARAYTQGELPVRKDVETYGVRWKPYRTVASWY